MKQTSIQPDNSTKWQEAIKLLSQEIEGECYADKKTRMLYATDASIYQILPELVIVPKSNHDLESVLRFCRKYSLSIVPRGSATSLAGQTVGKGVVLDFTKYMNNILDYVPEKKLIKVQPGVTRDQVNQLVAKDNLHFAPDPSTTSRATIAGMIANNSSGTRSLKYGKTIDHLYSVRVLLSDGTEMQLGETNLDQITSYADSVLTPSDKLHRFREMIFRHAGLIKQNYPKVLRRVTGYPLDEFIHTDRWNTAKLFCGSEGTLGIITEAEIKLEPIADYNALAIVHFHHRMKAIRAVKEIVKLLPAAVEMLDFNVLVPAKSHSLTRKIYSELIDGEPEAVMMVEFLCNTKKEVDDALSQIKALTDSLDDAYSCPVFTDSQAIKNASALRKEGLGLIMGDYSKRKPVAFIEDSAIPVENLADYVEEVLIICDTHNVQTILYAHASVGVLHIRPMLDLRDPADLEIMMDISESCFKLVKKYGGSWSGEHGDGRTRSYQMKNFFGEELYELFKQIKELFDPHYMMNPGVIIDADLPVENLRYGNTYKDLDEDYVYKYRKEKSFEEIVHNCSGVGACRNMSGGTMCPSFRATGNEADSTRGRANILRLAMSNQMQINHVASEEVLDVMDLCLSCKACKTECPSNVDMSKLKSEVLQKHFDRKGYGIKERMILYQQSIASMCSGTPSSIINGLMHSFLFRWSLEKVAGIDRRRFLPKYSNQSFDSWYKKTKKTQNKNKKKVLLYVDCYANFHDTQIGISAFSLLDRLGYEVEIFSGDCCQRPSISNGLLKNAVQKLNPLSKKLSPYLREGIPLIMLEPSCFSAMVDDAPDLIEDESLAQILEKNAIMIDEFLHSENIDFSDFAKVDRRVLVHEHCHQKALNKKNSSIELLRKSKIEAVDSGAGCCGMAGLFGYEKNNFEISEKIACQKLIPIVIESENDIIISNGFSCRHQISDFAGKKVLHITELLIEIAKDNLP
jgi:FAD/FMN-containing dehydrogenase/Fe-S oxidoreductase